MFGSGYDMVPGGPRIWHLPGMTPILIYKLCLSLLCTLDNSAHSFFPSDLLSTSPNQKRRRANTQGDACAHTNPSSAEDTANDSSDLTELDTEDEEVLDKEEVTGEEDEPVSNDDMEHSVIVVASGCPRRIRL